MNFKKHFYGIVLICTYIFAECFDTSFILGTGVSVNSTINISGISNPVLINKSSDNVRRLNELLKISLQRSLVGGDMKQNGPLIHQLLQKIAEKNISDSVLSESYYLVGIYHMFIKSYKEAIPYINWCISIKEKNGEID